MTKTKITLLISLLILTKGLFAQNLDCEWGYDGCFKDGERIIDLRSKAAIHVDEMFSCRRSLEGCSSEQEEFLSSLNSQNHLDDQDLRDLLNKASSDQKKNYFVPLDLSNKKLLTIAATTSLGLVVFKNDGEIMDFIQDHKTEKTQSVANVSNLFGREAQAPIILGSYFLGVVFKDGKLKDVGLIGLSSALATQLVTEAFKKTFDRVRPNSTNGPYEFFQDGNNSFFSGHTSAAFSLATIFMRSL